MQVDYLLQYHFKTPTRFPLEIFVAVSQSSSPANKDHRGWLRAISPEEIRHAIIKAVARDIRAGLDIAGWRFVFLTTTMTFIPIESDDQLYWAAAKKRQEIGASYETMYPTAAGNLAVEWHMEEQQPAKL